jgi:hypothetical protein
MLLQSLTLLASFVVALLHHYSDYDTRRESKVLQLCSVPCIFISCIICTNCAIAGHIRHHRTKLSSSLWLWLYTPTITNLWLGLFCSTNVFGSNIG